MIQFKFLVFIDFQGRIRGYMINPTIELIHKHGSVRNYKPDPITKETVEVIIAAAQRTATSSNLQMYSVIVTTDPEERARMQIFCGGQKHISKAPVFLTWCADLSRLDRVCQAKGYTQQAGYVENFLLAVTDAAIAAQNGGLAAESLGLGFCYIGAIRNNPGDVIRLLGLPKLVFPLVGMTLGWPATPQKFRPRLPLGAVLHWDRYDPVNEENLLKQYDLAMVESGIYRGRQAGPEDTIPEIDNGWTEHSARRVSQVLRPHLRDVLEDIGFELK
jgi:FMN reductase (NADPH)